MGNLFLTILVKIIEKMTQNTYVYMFEMDVFAIMCEHDLSQIELCGGLVKDLVYNYENGGSFFLVTTYFLTL